MGYIVDTLSYVLGILMDLFFRGLTFIGYPRLWACVVLFAFVTRLIFLRERISSYKTTLLTPVVRKELLTADPEFFVKTKDKELTVKRAALKKQVYKKYKLSNSSGCLTMLIQYPILVALFSVVKNPQKFVPSLETVASTDPHVNSFFGISLSDIPLDNLSFDSFTGCLFMLVPLIIIISNIIKMAPNLKRAVTVSQKIKVYSLFFAIILMLGWFSAKLPVVISLYWLAGDITYSILDFFIHKFLPKNKAISDILAQYNQEIEAAKAKRAEEAANNTAIEETPSDAEPNVSDKTSDIEATEIIEDTK